MLFSKSFGYALRGVLYVAMFSDDKPRIQLEEIAQKLSVPRHFLGKVMKGLVKENILRSLKGPYGGFSLHENTLNTALLKLAEITGDTGLFDSCVLRMRQCNARNPCPMHKEAEALKKKWQDLLASTTIGDLLKKDQPDFIQSIAIV